MAKPPKGVFVEAAAKVKEVNPLLDRIEEVEGDLHRLVELLGKQFGGNFAKEALAIVEKKQGK